MMTVDSIPDYLDTMTDESFWRRMQLRFDALSSLFDMRLETVEEAVGHEETIGDKEEWVSDAPRWDGHRAWLLLPYIDALDQTRLQEQFDIGRGLVPSIHDRLRKWELSPSFLHDWGQFCAAAGLIEFIYFSNTSIGHRRSALAGGKAVTEYSEAHKRWYAHYFLRIYKRGQWKQTEEAIERLIIAIIDGGIPVPAGYDVKWFEAILQVDDPKSPDYLRVRPAFRRRDFSTPKMETLIATGVEGIPPVDLEIPDP